LRLHDDDQPVNALSCVNITKHINTMRTRNAESLILKGGGTYSDHCVLEGLRETRSIRHRRLKEKKGTGEKNGNLLK
jgi:hypothetical protein